MRPLGRGTHPGKPYMSSATLEAPTNTESRNAPSQEPHASQIVSFRLANEEYGVDIMQVQEIILIGQITPMPHVPPYVCGLINLRGHVIPIIDLRARFELERASQTENSRIIVLNIHAKTVGIIVDAVAEVLRISPGQIETAAVGTAGVGQQYIGGLVKLEEKLLILLNIDQIMAEKETP